MFRVFNGFVDMYGLFGLYSFKFIVENIYQIKVNIFIKFIIIRLI